MNLVLLQPGENNAKYSLLPHSRLERYLVEAANRDRPMVAFGGVSDEGVGASFYVTNVEQIQPRGHDGNEAMFTCDDTIRGAKALIISSS